MHELYPLLISLVDEVPEPEDVKAGWTAFALFLIGCVVVGLLGWSLTRQLRKAQAAKDAGVYGDPPVDRDRDRDDDEPRSQA